MKTNYILLIAMGAAAVLMSAARLAPAMAQTTPAPTEPALSATTVNFAVMRNGAQIGTNSIRFGRDGSDTTVQMVTHVKVGFAFVTFYQFDQTESERWGDGRLLALNATTNDNGTVHRASAAAKDGRVIVRCDGKVSATVPTIVPFSLWNPALMAQNIALDARDGRLETIRVSDRGEENIVVQGHSRQAHHYQIVAGFPQDVWYDDGGQLVRVELKGSDGSTILYQMV